MPPPHRLAKSVPGVELDPARGDRDVPREGDHRRDASRARGRGRPAGARPTREWSSPNTSSCTDTSASTPRRVDDRPQLDARGRWHVEREVGDLGDEQRLGRLGHETGREQPLRQIRRAVVGVVLPLPRARVVARTGRSGRRSPRRRRDRSRSDQVTPLQPSQSETARTTQSSCSTRSSGPSGLRPPADLLVERRQQRFSVHAANPRWLTRAEAFPLPGVGSAADCTDTETGRPPPAPADPTPKGSHSARTAPVPG